MEQSTTAWLRVIRILEERFLSLPLCSICVFGNPGMCTRIDLLLRHIATALSWKHNLGGNDEANGDLSLVLASSIEEAMRVIHMQTSKYYPCTCSLGNGLANQLAFIKKTKGNIPPTSPARLESCLADIAPGRHTEYRHVVFGNVIDSTESKKKRSESPSQIGSFTEKGLPHLVKHEEDPKSKQVPFTETIHHQGMDSTGEDGGNDDDDDDDDDDGEEEEEEKEEEEENRPLDLTKCVPSNKTLKEVLSALPLDLSNTGKDVCKCRSESGACSSTADRNIDRGYAFHLPDSGENEKLRKQSLSEAQFTVTDLNTRGGYSSRIPCCRSADELERGLLFASAATRGYRSLSDYSDPFTLLLIPDPFNDNMLSRPPSAKGSMNKSTELHVLNSGVESSVNKIWRRHSGGRLTTIPHSFHSSRDSGKKNRTAISTTAKKNKTKQLRHSASNKVPGISSLLCTYTEQSDSSTLIKGRNLPTGGGSVTDLGSHSLDVVGEGQLLISPVPKPFFNKQQQQQQQQQHKAHSWNQPQDSYQLPLIDNIWSKPLSLNSIHSRWLWSELNDRGYRFCDCGLVTKDLTLFYFHYESHSHDGVFRCSICQVENGSGERALGHLVGLHALDVKYDAVGNQSNAST